MTDDTTDPVEGASPEDETQLDEGTRKTPLSKKTPAAQQHGLPELDEIRTLFPDLEVIDVLGAGGMGVVFKARQPRLDRFVAVKLLSKNLASDPQFIARFEREARAMAKLSHPNIINVHDFGEREGYYFLTMEFVDGGDVQEKMQSGDLTPSGVLELLPQICTALQFAHEKGITHRDIKPANVLLDREGTVKIADFGLAKMVQGEDVTFQTVEGTSMGTPFYMAPEQMTGAESVDQRADIYSLGVMIYHMLTGRLPQGDFPPASTITSHPKIGENVDNAIMRALAQDPEVRFSEVQELYEALQVVRERRDAEAGEGGEREKAEKESKSSGAPVGLIAVVVIALLAVAGGAWWFLGQGDNSPQTETPAIAQADPVIAPESTETDAGRDRPPGGPSSGKGKAPTTPDPSAATKDQPFANTLGMTFVPVPIGNGPSAGERVLFCRHETRWKDYAAFAKANEGVDENWKNQVYDGYDVRENEERPEDHPVTNVSWEDARAFCAWLTEKERAAGRLPEDMAYRLPTDLEWSWAVGIGDREDPEASPSERRDQKRGRGRAEMYPWEGGWPPPPGAANVSDQSRKEEAPSSDEKVQYAEGYDDGYPATAPVMAFASNELGLFDLGANVREWCEDEIGNHDGGSRRVYRGGSWFGDGPTCRSAHRHWPIPDHRSSGVGFRPVLANVEPTKRASNTPDPAAATKDQPFANTLGMTFVPVPIGNGPSAGERVLFCRHETRWKDYAAFAEANEGVDEPWKSQVCNGYDVRANEERPEDHPVTRVSWEDAQAFCAWLTEKERAAGRLTEDMAYRLPTDLEWSWAVGIGDREDPEASPKERHDEKGGRGLGEVYPWEGGWPPPTGAANVSDQSRKEEAPDPNETDDYYEKDYDDGYPATSPVMAFAGNELGLFDLGGNAREWCEDEFGGDEEDGSNRVFRGGSWVSGTADCRSANRSRSPQGFRTSHLGFRPVLAKAAATLEEQSPSEPAEDR